MSWLEETRAKMAASRAKFKANKAKRKAKMAKWREKNASGGVETPVMNLDAIKESSPYGKVPAGVQDVPSHLQINPDSRNIASRLSNFEQNEASRSGIASASFDVTSPSEVKKVQRMLGVKTDGIFGPKTESAWRDYVNRSRADQGREGYFWDEVAQNTDALDEVAEAAESNTGNLGYNSILGPEGYAGKNLMPKWNKE